MSYETKYKCILCGEHYDKAGAHDTCRAPKLDDVPKAWENASERLRRSFDRDSLLREFPEEHAASGGTKHDGDKPRMDLLDPYAMEQLAKVLTFGASKYAAHNWRQGLAKSRLLAAALRHLFAYLGGQDKDPETGLSHVAHAMCCCMFLLGLEHRPELDDRWKP